MGREQHRPSGGAFTADGCYDELTADDVRDAADLLSGVYEKTKHLDGYVSIEVLPAYAHDPERTVAYARHIFNKVGRPNVMIKVPGTMESPEAIRALIYDGISVNVTLLFSVFQYERCAKSFLQGLIKAVSEGRDVTKTASVASMFISRIDSKVDSLLDAFASRENQLEKKGAIMALKGKVAVANAKMIYRSYKDLFAPAKFMDLYMKGGRPQRVLWASTGTKNPLYNDCLYVDELIGPMTVNTMPHATVLAFEDHGKPALTLESGRSEAEQVLIFLEQLGVSLDRICEEAQDEGVKAFEQSFETLMKSIAAKVGS
mgnify:CR=1 FL=1